MNRLDRDSLQSIISHLNPRDLRNAMQVNREWRDVGTYPMKMADQRDLVRRIDKFKTNFNSRNIEEDLPSPHETFVYKHVPRMSHMLMSKKIHNILCWLDKPRNWEALGLMLMNPDIFFWIDRNIWDTLRNILHIFSQFPSDPRIFDIISDIDFVTKAKRRRISFGRRRKYKRKRKN